MRRFVDSEERIAQLAAAFLAAEGWECYFEVQPFRGCGRADIVGVRQPLTIIVEVKTSASLQLLEQANRWIGWANYVATAVPSHSRGSKGMFFDHLCRSLGIGVISVCSESVWRVDPRLARASFRSQIAESLNEGQKSYAAPGNSQNSYWSPFKETCRNLASVVRENPGIRIREAMERIHHHYSTSGTARSAMLKWAQAGSVPNVEARRDGRFIRLHWVEGKSQPLGLDPSAVKE